MAAIKTIPQIRTVLEEAKQKTDNAQEALADAESNAQKASAAALHAQNATAAEASEVMDIECCSRTRGLNGLEYGMGKKGY